MAKSVLVLLLLIVALSGCTKFHKGECIRHIEYGFIWRIVEARLGFGEYIVQGWFDGIWGLPVKSTSDFDDGRYIKISCPSSTRTVASGK